MNNLVLEYIGHREKRCDRFTALAFIRDFSLNWYACMQLMVSPVQKTRHKTYAEATKLANVSLLHTNISSILDENDETISVHQTRVYRSARSDDAFLFNITLCEPNYTDQQCTMETKTQHSIVHACLILNEGTVRYLKAYIKSEKDSNDIAKQGILFSKSQLQVLPCKALKEQSQIIKLGSRSWHFSTRSSIMTNKSIVDSDWNSGSSMADSGEDDDIVTIPDICVITGSIRSASAASALHLSPSDSSLVSPLLSPLAFSPSHVFSASTTTSSVRLEDIRSPSPLGLDLDPLIASFVTETVATSSHDFGNTLHTVGKSHATFFLL